MRRFSNKVGYDQALDPATWGGYSPARAAKFAPQWKKELNVSKSVAAAKRVRAGKSNNQRAERHEAEERAVENLRRVVNAIEFTLHDLSAHPGCAAGLINQKQIHNALFFLKTKCGVRFEKSDLGESWTALDRPGTSTA